MDATLAFYRTLGLTFMQEQHGTGPVHHSCDLGGPVLEIYPGTSGNAPDPGTAGATMLGFRVSSVDSVLLALQQVGASVIAPPKDSKRGRRAVVGDPEGRAVEISQ